MMYVSISVGVQSSEAIYFRTYKCIILDVFDGDAIGTDVYRSQFNITHPYLFS